MMVRVLCWCAVAASLFSGCATCDRSAGRPFAHGKDNFAFTNELVWTYQFETNGTVKTHQSEPAPRHPHRCFPMARAAREFFYHAQFEPALPKLDENSYHELVRQVVRRSSRCPSGESERIVVPGYADLYSLSRDFGELLRQEGGGAVLSYLQRGNWRMIFPVSQRRFRKTADELRKEINAGRLPIVHVYRFPKTTLNHALLLYAVHPDEAGWRFRAYDPNNPQRPAELKFDAIRGTFLLERNEYFAGGPVRVYEVYCSLLY